MSETVRNEVEQALSAAGVRGEFFLKNPRRMYLTVDPKDLVATARAVFDLPGVRFAIATGQETVAGGGRRAFEVLHHFAFDHDNCVVSVRVSTGDDPPTFDSISGVVRAAQYIEREMHDLLGIEFRNHPGLNRLLLSEDWPDGVHPLRRGEPLEGRMEKRI